MRFCIVLTKRFEMQWRGVWYQLWLLRFLLLVFATAAQLPDYAPVPQPGQETEGHLPPGSPPAPPFHGGDGPAPGLWTGQAPGSAPGLSTGQAPGLAPDLSTGEAPGPTVLSPDAAPANAVADIIWCAVRDEYETCLNKTGVLSTPDLSWTCVSRESKGNCMEAIQKGDATLMTLEAGLAYVAFLNYSMKAIVAEEYTFHAQHYAAVAVVNKRICDDNPNLKLDDLRNLKSCHPGYLSASGWNQPVETILNNVQRDRGVPNNTLPNDVKLLTSFFSASCAPSELGQGGICTACGNSENNSFCSSVHNYQYTGESGAFRCLMEERGDVAFLRAETPTLYSSDGLNSQTWSTKSVDEFMYLCMSGGCKPVNDNHRNCHFADIPADVVMTQNSLPERLRKAIVRALLSANWTEALYTGRNYQNYLLSVSTQGLGQVNQLTRQYLGSSAFVAQTVMDLQSDRIHLSTTSEAVRSSVPANSLLVVCTLVMGVLCTFFNFW